MSKKVKTPSRLSQMARSVPEMIAFKRDGGALEATELEALIQGFVTGEVADYQMTALAMAIFFRGMTAEETAALTLAMRDSGDVLDLSNIPGFKVDKHSTGGVGDKVSICLAPMVTACGLRVPMISGRGLGHTGGTLDKLEAIPGFKVDTTTKRFIRQIEKIGCALIGQTADLAPADRRLYALRDVSATVESIPLITASILSKKLAEGIDALVLDVKVGEGAFMKTEKQARELAESIVRVGRHAGKKVSALLTRMDAPLGHAVGNAVESAEAFAVLSGSGPDDLVECTFALGAEMLRLAGVAKSEAAARKMLAKVIEDGSAARKMQEVVKAQGGDPRVVLEPDRLPSAPHAVIIPSPSSGYVKSINAREIGLTAVHLGAGRTRADQEVDPAVGILLDKKPGDEVSQGERLARILVRNRAAARAVTGRILEAYTITQRRTAPLPLVIDTIRR